MFDAPTTSGAIRRQAGRGLLVPIIPLVATLSLITLTACSSSNPPAPTATDLVARADISTGVTASGSLSAITTQDLGFSKGGQLRSVSVKVGDRVKEGQTLAKIDDYALEQAVATAQANVDQQKAVLTKLTKNPAIAGGNSTVAQARAVVAATKHQAAVQAKSDNSAIHQARKLLAAAEDAEDNAQDAVAKAKAACEDAGQRAENSAKAVQEAQDSYATALASGDPVAIQNALDQLNVALQLNQTNSSSTVCSGVGSAESGSTAATQGVASSRAALEAAKQRKKTDAAAGKLAVENTEQAVVAAQNSVNSTSSDRPSNLDQQKAVVETAETALDSAEHDLDDATLKAPFSGTVSAINGTVGEFLSPSTGTTALAPGSGAAIPGTDAAAGAGAQGAASATRPGGSQFLVISDINQLQVVLPFEESDAAQIKTKRKVTVGFDAVPDLTEEGTVSSVAPTGTAISGVISYYVTVRLDGTDPRLKDGQTARATVVTEEHPNVLSVPNSAVRAQGAQSAVVVVDGSGAQQTVAFEPGLVGPDRTEVLSGLQEGQRIVSQKGN